MTVNYDELSKQILDLDSQVRFAGVANSKGELVAGGQKSNIERILSDDDVKMSIHYALQKRDLYTNLAYKIGREQSAVNEFEKVTLISIPINTNDLFLVSMEPKADYLKVINYIHSVLDSQKDSE